MTKDKYQIIEELIKKTHNRVERVRIAEFKQHDWRMANTGMSYFKSLNIASNNSQRVLDSAWKKLEKKIRRLK